MMVVDSVSDGVADSERDPDMVVLELGVLAESDTDTEMLVVCVCESVCVPVGIRVTVGPLVAVWVNDTLVEMDCVCPEREAVSDAVGASLMVTDCVGVTDRLSDVLCVIDEEMLALAETSLEPVGVSDSASGRTPSSTSGPIGAIAHGTLRRKPAPHRLSPSRLALKKFMVGVPKNPATKRLAGRS